MNVEYTPRHVAIILDGNRRWAKEKGLPIFEGHRRGFHATINIGKKARKLGIKVLTYWMFSTENWDRTEEEKTYLWKLLESGINSYLKTALKEQIKIIHLGRKDRIPKYLTDEIKEVEEKTRHFTKYYLAIALDYGGRDDVIRGIKKIQKSVTKIQDLTQETFNKFLDTKDLPYPNPDLIIRTGGEFRTSGFMIWQAAYSEYIFVKKYLPDFTTDDFEKCIKEYSVRQRRFGR